MGRFINADVLMSTGQGVIGCNMFCYCGNNPVNRADDDGEFWHLVVGAVIGAVVSVASTAITNAIKGEKGSFLDYALAFATGAVSGALSASGLPAIAIAGINAGVEATATLITQVSEDRFDATEMVTSATIGFVTGYLGGDGLARNAHVEGHLKGQFRNMVKQARNGKPLKMAYKYWASQTMTIQRNLCKQVFKNSWKDFGVSLVINYAF